MAGPHFTPSPPLPVLRASPGDMDADAEALLEWEMETGLEAQLSGLSCSEGASPRTSCSPAAWSPEPSPPPEGAPAGAALAPAVPRLALTGGGGRAAQPAAVPVVPGLALARGAAAAPAPAPAACGGSEGGAVSPADSYVPGRDLEEDLARELAAEVGIGGG